MKKIAYLVWLISFMCNIANGRDLDIDDFTHARLYRCDPLTKEIEEGISLKVGDKITNAQVQSDSAMFLQKRAQDRPLHYTFFIILDKRDADGNRSRGRFIIVRDGNIVMNGKNIKLNRLIKDKSLSQKVDSFFISTKPKSQAGDPGYP